MYVTCLYIVFYVFLTILNLIYFLVQVNLLSYSFGTRTITTSSNAIFNLGKTKLKKIFYNVKKSFIKTLGLTFFLVLGYRELI